MCAQGAPLISNIGVLRKNPNFGHFGPCPNQSYPSCLQAPGQNQPGMGQPVPGNQMMTGPNQGSQMMTGPNSQMMGGPATGGQMMPGPGGQMMGGPNPGGQMMAGPGGQMMQQRPPQMGMANQMQQPNMSGPGKTCSDYCKSRYFHMHTFLQI